MRQAESPACVAYAASRIPRPAPRVPRPASPSRASHPGSLCYALRFMRQAVIPRYGPPDVFEMRNAPEVSPRDEEIRIRVRAAGVNFADVLARLGLYPDAPKPPMVVGYEVAGHVDAVGEGVTGLA